MTEEDNLTKSYYNKKSIGRISNLLVFNGVSIPLVDKLSISFIDDIIKPKTNRQWLVTQFMLNKSWNFPGRF